MNVGSVDKCGSANKTCPLSGGGSTCAACCIGTDCNLYNGNDSVSVDQNPNPPSCCTGTTPTDTCSSLSGIDPKNNIMSYVPDYCGFEFTSGQMLRMMAQAKTKTYIYCNYADILDTTTCSNIPCGPDATSPNCLKPTLNPRQPSKRPTRRPSIRSQTRRPSKKPTRRPSNKPKPTKPTKPTNSKPK
jgi:hypothetical protein